MNKELLTSLELYTVARFFYVYGAPIIENFEYDMLEANLRKTMPDEPILHRTASDDPIPWAALAKCEVDSQQIAALRNVSRKTGCPENWDLYYNYLASESSKSIQAFFSWEEAYPWLMGARGIPLNLGLKIDGNFSRSLYLRSEQDPEYLDYKITFSRGRTAEPFDFTAAASRIFRPRIKVPDVPFFVVQGEVYCDPSALATINELYGEDYVTPRGLGLSMLRTNAYSDEDYRFLRCLAFNCSLGNSMTEKLGLLNSLDFDTTLHYTVTLPPNATFDEVHDIIYSYMCALKQVADECDIPSDGIVIQIDDTSTAGDLRTDTQFDGGMIALKTDFWLPEMLSAEVVHVEITQQAENCNCVAIVKPTLTKIGKRVTRVNCHNAGILIEAGIKPGVVIEFLYKNETTVDLLY